MADTEPLFSSAHRPQPPSIAKPAGKPYSETRELGPMTIIAAFAIGAALGAGAALLYAPDSGRGMRRTIGRRVRKLTRRERGTWKRLKRTMERAIEARKSRPAAAATEVASAAID